MMEKEIVNQVQEVQRVPYRINPRRNMPRHILIKLTKTKHKERISKAARVKQQVAYKGNPIYLTADLSEYICMIPLKVVLVAQLWVTHCDPMDCNHCPWNYPDKNSGVGNHSLLQGIFQTQGLNLGLLHYRQILYHLSHQGSPMTPLWHSIPSICFVYISHNIYHHLTLTFMHVWLLLSQTAK